MSIVPLNSEETAGRFRVWLYLDLEPSDPILMWDRKVEGGFPELKDLVRDNQLYFGTLIMSAPAETTNSRSHSAWKVAGPL